MADTYRQTQFFLLTLSERKPKDLVSKLLSPSKIKVSSYWHINT